jgi:PAS domain S-box-containing protein
MVMSTIGQQPEMVADQGTMAQWRMLHALPMPVVWTDLQDHIVRANPAYCALMGYAEDDLKTIDGASLVYPEDRAMRLASLARLPMDGNGSGACEWRYTCKDGGLIRVRAHLSVACDDSGKATHLIAVIEDITARKAIEERLQDSEKLLRIAVQMAGVGGWSMELPNMRIQWTDECAAIHDEAPGFSPTAREAAKYYLGKWRTRFYESLGACIGQGTVFDEEVQIVTAKGRKVWARVTGQAVRDSNGVITRLHGAFMAVTAHTVVSDENESRARQQAGVARLGQLALTDSSLAALRDEAVKLLATGLGVEFSGLLEVLKDGKVLKPVAGYGWKDDGEDSEVSTGPSSVAGYTLVGKVPQTIEDLANDPRFVMSPRLRDHGVASGILVVLENEGGTRGVMGAFCTRKRHFTADDVHFFQGVANVVTQAENRKRAESRLQLQAAVIEKMAEGVVVADENGSIVSTNPALDAMFGFAPGELIGRHLSRLRNWNDPEVREVITQTKKRIGNMSTWLGEVERQKTDGTRFSTQTQVSVVEVDGVRHIFSVLEDITQRSRDREALRLLNAELETRVQSRTAELERSRHQAEQASQAKSTFLATMSHEIRTPVNGVIGMVDVLQQTALQPHQLEMVQLIQQSADALLEIIDDILDISRIEAGKLEIDNAPMSLSQVVEKVCALSRHVAAGKRVDLTVFIDPDLPAQVAGDAVRLSQVLFNLIGNAIKFSSTEDRRGQVSVRALLAVQSGNQATVELRISDDGIGMDNATVERLFTPFTQADASTTRRFGGTGLGLAISRKLVQLMGGSINVQSALHRGSTFTVQLLCTRVLAGLVAPSGTAAPAKQLTGTWQRGLRVLVAEDHETNQKVILQQLSLLGLEVELAGDGAEALERWRKGNFSLVLTDLHMPVMDGYQLAAAIRAEERGIQRIPIVALTANALKSEAEHCRQVGMDDYMSKPAPLARLHGMLEKWLPSRADPSAAVRAAATTAVHAPPSSAAPAALDVQVLVEMVGDDPVVIRQLLRSFRADATRLAQELQQAWKSVDLDRAAAVAHKLKSSARSVGALKLGQLCADMESAARNGTPSALATLLAEFEIELLQVRAAVHRVLDHGPSTP